MLELDKLTAAERQQAVTVAASEPPLLALAQSCQTVLTDHGFWLERYGSSLGCTWVRFRRVVHEDPRSVATQVFLIAHDAEGQAFLADDYLVQDHGLTQESRRHGVWPYVTAEDLEESMRQTLRTVRAWARESPAELT